MRHAPRIVRIESRKMETQDIVSLTVRDQACADAKPGQFAMMWIPGVDEIPMSILPTKGEDVTFVVKSVGDATVALLKKRVGDNIGIRGPYGTFFRPKKRGRLLLVGGGTGIVPLTFLMRSLQKSGRKVSIVIGAKTKYQLFFLDTIRKTARKGDRTVVATDDGTCGVKGLASEVAADLCEENHFGEVFACGPEQMISTIFGMCEEKHVPLQASLERIMKCGIGICGSCCIGEYRVCVDGPVFQHVQLRDVMDELGRWTRDHSGKIVRF
jgi:dihydroorotate dehydrogenase electron transfer subunit